MQTTKISKYYSNIKNRNSVYFNLLIHQYYDKLIIRIHVNITYYIEIQNAECTIIQISHNIFFIFEGKLKHAYTKIIFTIDQYN